MKTYDSLLQSNGHVNKTIDILKIDVEYSEWDALEHMLKKNSLRHVKQLLFESHTKEMSQNQVTGKNDYLKYIHVWNSLQAMGFRQWRHHTNFYRPTIFISAFTGEYRTCCYEHFLVNTQFGKSKS